MRRVLGWLMFLALLVGTVTAARLTSSPVVNRLRRNPLHLPREVQPPVGSPAATRLPEDGTVDGRLRLPYTPRHGAACR